MSARPIGTVVNRAAQKQFVGNKVSIKDLKDQLITINDYTELPSKLPGQIGQTYFLVSANLGTTSIIFATSSKVIKDLLKQAKDKFPVSGTVRQQKSKSGPFSYWTLE